MSTRLSDHDVASRPTARVSFGPRVVLHVSSPGVGFEVPL
jgi:hypothetical protein